jgi:hypothetical protein
MSVWMRLRARFRYMHRAMRDRRVMSSRGRGMFFVPRKDVPAFRLLRSDRRCGNVTVLLDHAAE